MKMAWNDKGKERVMAAVSGQEEEGGWGGGKEERAKGEGVGEGREGAGGQKRTVTVGGHRGERRAGVREMSIGSKQQLQEGLDEPLIRQQPAWVGERTAVTLENSSSTVAVPSAAHRPYYMAAA